MGKLVSVVCESMILGDLVSPLPGFSLSELDLTPSRRSADSMWLMQTSAPLPPHQNVHSGSKLFADPSVDFISDRHKTRIISNFWAYRNDPSCFDPEVTINVKQRISREPNVLHWHTLIDFLDGVHDHEWIIYWSTIGHAACNDCRIGKENRGIPDNLRMTCTEWMRLISEEILPRVPDDVRMLVHSDHGTGRKDNSGFDRGFLMHRGFDDVPDKLGWAGLRKLEEEALCA